MLNEQMEQVKQSVLNIQYKKRVVLVMNAFAKLHKIISTYPAEVNKNSQLEHFCAVPLATENN